MAKLFFNKSLTYKTKKMKRIDKLFNPLPDDVKQMAFTKANYTYFAKDIHNASYEAKEAALKALSIKV